MRTRGEGSIEEVLRTLVRRVDKKMGYVVTPGSDAENVILTLRVGKVSRDLPIPVVAIQETLESLAERERMRVRIKRARDSMWASMKQIPPVSTRQTKITPSEGASYFRTGGGGFRR